MTEEWARTARATLGAMLLAERALLARTRRAARDATAPLIEALVLLPSGDRKRAAQSAVGAINGALATVRRDLAAAVAAGRIDTKRVSLERLAVEWEQVKRAIKRLDLEPPVGDIPPFDVGTEDAAEAEVVGQSYAAAWGAALLSVTWRWSSGDLDSLARGALDAVRAIDFRLRRIAATENTKAFADARDEGMGWVADTYGEARWFPALLKQWDATLDRKVCPICSGLDGTLRPWGVDFPSGAEPGHVHAHCRCAPVTVFLPVRLDGELVPGRQVDDENPREAT